MSVSNSSYFKPDDALQELLLQEQILNSLIEGQTILQLLIKKGIVTREEVAGMRSKVRSLPKYKLAIEDIQKQKEVFSYAKDNPEEHLRAILKAKLGK